MSSADPLLTSRRAAIGLAVLAAGGCTVQGEPPATGPTGSSAPTGDTAADPDVAVVTNARRELGGMLDLLDRASRRHPDLADVLGALTALHTTHDEFLAEVADTAPSSAGGASVPARKSALLDLVRSRERALQGELARLAGRARSGPLARLLASMAAAVSQQVSVLPRPKEAS